MKRSKGIGQLLALKEVDPKEGYICLNQALISDIKFVKNLRQKCQRLKKKKIYNNFCILIIPDIFLKYLMF